MASFPRWRYGVFSVYEMPQVLCYVRWQMKELHPIAGSAPANGSVAKTPVMEADAVLTPKAEARVANRLPKREQLNQFEKNLEEHDPGNQPA